MCAPSLATAVASAGHGWWAATHHLICQSNSELMASRSRLSSDTQSQCTYLIYTPLSITHTHTTDTYSKLFSCGVQMARRLSGK